MDYVPGGLDLVCMEDGQCLFFQAIFLGSAPSLLLIFVSRKLSIVYKTLDFSDDFVSMGRAALFLNVVLHI